MRYFKSVPHERLALLDPVLPQLQRPVIQHKGQG